MILVRPSKYASSDYQLCRRMPTGKLNREGEELFNRSVIGLQKDELEPYTGEMLISRPHNLTGAEVLKGMRHGLWHLKNEQGVIISRSYMS